MNKYRKDFPFFKAIDEQQTKENAHLVYLDTAATAQRPYIVMHSMSHFYTTENANPLRGLYSLSERATQAYENSRQTVANFINAKVAIASFVLCSLNKISSLYAIHSFLNSCHFLFNHFSFSGYIFCLNILFHSSCCTLFSSSFFLLFFSSNFSVAYTIDSANLS